MNLHLAAVQFFLQLALILVVCQLVGRLAKLVGQPQVVAEMIAGVLLGPSLFGFFLPEWQAWFFPWGLAQGTVDTRTYLFPASQLGLALYMFIVGLEFRLDVLKDHWTGSAAVSLAGMLAPFALGGATGWYLHQHTALFPPATSAFEASLFLGASLCITAFPMLARIIHFKGLHGTLMGTLAIGAGAMDDAAAWCLLAVVLASFNGNFSHALLGIGGGLAYVTLMLGAVRPLLERWEARSLEGGKLSESGIVAALAIMALGAFFTDYIELHAVFGAFIAGAAMPRKLVAEQLVEKIQPLSVALLLPLFFTYSGLNTRITLLNSWTLWGYCGVILLASTVGKGVACWLAARWAGLSQREALGVGALMNSRGLMELIIINIGLQKGIISPELFACLVIMAVVTTLMASPLFDWLMRQAPASPVLAGTPDKVPT